jgi:hypothetical protein
MPNSLESMVVCDCFSHAMVCANRFMSAPCEWCAQRPRNYYLVWDMEPKAQSFGNWGVEIRGIDATFKGTPGRETDNRKFNRVPWRRYPLFGLALSSG